MSRNRGHASKNRFERDYYTRYIKSKDYEPTVDESLKFEDSSDSKPDYSEPTSNKSRKISLKYQLEDYVKENWIPGVITLIVIIGGYFMVTSQITMGKIETLLFKMDEDVKEIKEDIKGTNNELSKINDQSKENSWKLDQLEKERIRSTPLPHLNKNTKDMP